MTCPCPLARASSGGTDVPGSPPPPAGALSREAAWARWTGRACVLLPHFPKLLCWAVYLKLCLHIWKIEIIIQLRVVDVSFP